MAQLFLSYAREDRECAELLADALLRRGWTVWWDRQIHVGRAFSDVIEQELDEARCVIVLWSHQSVKSEWVRSEAEEAMRRGVLVPLRIEDVRPPLAFRQLHNADLCDWRRGLDSPEFAACVESIELLLQKPPSADDDVKTLPAELWIAQDGQQFRVPDATTLRRWAKEGRVRPDSQIYDPAVKRWMRASDLPDLRGAFPAPQPQPAPPPQRPSRSWLLPTFLGIGVVIFLVIVAAVALNRKPDYPTTDTYARTAPDTAVSQGFLDTAAAATLPQPISVSLQNDCKDGTTIAVAICYQDAKGVWITKGWYNVGTNATSPNVLQAYGNSIYFYGNAGNLHWQGTEKDQHSMIPIHPTSAFEAPVEQFAGQGVTQVAFVGRGVPAGQTAYTEVFSCN